jgi:hypothetical protein
MKLSEEDKRAFYNGGFFVMRALFTPDEVRGAREALERLYATAQTLTQTGDHDGAFFALSFPLGAPVIVRDGPMAQARVTGPSWPCRA